MQELDELGLTIQKISEFYYNWVNDAKIPNQQPVKIVRIISQTAATVKLVPRSQLIIRAWKIGSKFQQKCPCCLELKDYFYLSHTVDSRRNLEYTIGIFIKSYLSITCIPTNNKDNNILNLTKYILCKSCYLVNKILPII